VAVVVDAAAVRARFGPIGAICAAEWHRAALDRIGLTAVRMPCPGQRRVK
jgi:hypothetical protein